MTMIIRKGYLMSSMLYELRVLSLAYCDQKIGPRVANMLSLSALTRFPSIPRHRYRNMDALQ